MTAQVKSLGILLHCPHCNKSLYLMTLKELNVWQKETKKPKRKKNV